MIVCPLGCLTIQSSSRGNNLANVGKLAKRVVQPFKLPRKRLQNVRIKTKKIKRGILKISTKREKNIKTADKTSKTIKNECTKNWLFVLFYYSNFHSKKSVKYLKVARPGKYFQSLLKSSSLKSYKHKNISTWTWNYKDAIWNTKILCYCVSCLLANQRGFDLSTFWELIGCVKSQIALVNNCGVTRKHWAFYACFLFCIL